MIGKKKDQNIYFLFLFTLYTNVALADLPRNYAVSISYFGLSKKEEKICVYLK